MERRAAAAVPWLVAALAVALGCAAADRPAPAPTAAAAASVVRPRAERFAGVLHNAELPRRLATLLGWEWTPGPR